LLDTSDYIMSENGHRPIPHNISC